MAEILLYTAGFIILLAMFTASFRFFRGPDSVNRILAFDVLTIISISLIAVIAHITGRIIYLDVAVVYGLLSFLGVVTISKYLDGGL